MATKRARTEEKENVAAVLQRAKELSVQPWPMPSITSPTQVLLRVERVGICGSDVHYWQHGRIGNFVVNEPMVLGHESAGTVVAVGDQVRNVSVGDRVAIEPGIPCRMCARCKDGRYNLCPYIEFHATPPHHGTLTHYITHQADLCFKLPENVSLEEGALCEPLSVGVFACERADVRPGCSVAVMGCGPIGLVTLMAAKAFGASCVVMTDVLDSRTEFAKGMGADQVLNVKGLSEEDVASQLRQMAGGKIDIVIECCGIESTTRAGVLACREGGVVCLVGMGKPDTTLPLLDAAIREVDIRGVFRYKNTYPTCINLIASGRVNAKALVSHKFSFPDQLMEGFETARSGQAIKVMFDF